MASADHRIKYLIFVGSSPSSNSSANQLDTFKSRFQEACLLLTRASGGLSYGYCSGTWMPCAANGDGPWLDAVQFPEIEDGLTGWIQVGFTENMEAQVRDVLHGEFAKMFVDLGVEHIHVERHVFQAMHFRIK